MTVVDSHQHFWQLGRFDYAWLTPELKAIYHDFLPENLFPLMQAEGIDRCILVQADSSVEEIAWMLSLAEKHPQIIGVIGWADLLDAELENRLASFGDDIYLKGVRPGIPGKIANINALDRAFQVLGQNRLSCDFLVNEEGYPVVIELAKRYPQVWFVLDHLAGVRITPGGQASWAKNLRRLASLPNVVMKLSGYLSAAEPKLLSLETLRPYIENALELFGVERLMFGSDWPVCTLGGSYGQAVGLLHCATESLSSDEKEAVWGGTAVKVYRLLV